MEHAKKNWAAPEVTRMGTVAELTQQVKNKTPGTSDDFQVPGVCDLNGPCPS